MIDKGQILVENYVNQVPVPVQPAIIYTPFGYSNFHIQPDVFNLFYNHHDIRFYEKATENPHENIHDFLRLYEVISHEEMSADAF